MTEILKMRIGATIALVVFAVIAAMVYGVSITNAGDVDGEGSNGVVEEAEGEGEGEILGVVELATGGQFHSWAFGDTIVSSAFGSHVKIAWLFNSDTVSWTSWIPALGVTDFSLVDGSVLWIVTDAAITISYSD